MREFSLWLLLSVLSVLVPLNVHSAAEESLPKDKWSKIPSQDFKVAPPPEPGSPQYIKDFQVLHEYQENRSEDDCEAAAAQKEPDLESMFGPGTKILNSHEVKKFEDLWNKVAEFTDRVSSYHKAKFRRPRPYQVDTSLEPCIEKISSAKAYPSSHASMAMSTGCLLAKLFTERKDTILKQARYLGLLRVIVGVHHPSDVQAGQALGQEICLRLAQDKSFLKDLRKITNKPLEQ